MEVAQHGAERFAACAGASGSDRFAVALAGGTTPAEMYKALASSYRERIDWRRVQFFFGDERAVPPDHVDSNYRLAEESLFRPLKIIPSQVHRMKGEMENLVAAAEQYAEELHALPTDGLPQFDLILLGLGPDGHTASLFPGSPALHEQSRWVVPVLSAPKPPPRRLTLTAPVLNAARQVLFLVTGANKAAAIREIFCGTALPEQYPAKLVRPRGQRVSWLLDEAAASELNERR
jgi:6-phosphogluconolactonase